MNLNDVIGRIQTLKEMEETNCNHKWLFTEEELLNTPSVRAGMSLEQELTFRQRQAMLIQTIGLKAGLTQLAVNTSVIFMHRFFMYRTVKTFPRVHLALGFAFAGGKVEESARKLEHLIRTAVEVIRQNRNKEFLDKSDPLSYEMDCQWRAKMQILFDNNCNIESPAYLEMRKLVLECETEIYGVIGFQLQIVHPHNYVIRMCALLGAENIKDISQYAYNLATASSQLTMLCLKYKPETIATMCLNIASKAHSVRFEPMKDSNVKWYQVLVPNTDFSEIEAVSEEFLHVIKGCPLLPSWMTSLARAPRPNNTRVMPGPSRGPGASSASAPPGGRQNPPATLSTTAPTASGNAPPSSTTAPMPQNYPSRSQATAASLSSSQLPDSRQLLISGRGAHLQNEAVISPGNKYISAETGGSVPVAGASDAHVKDSSSHSRPHAGSAQMRPHHSSSALPAGAAQHQQHRPHPPGNGRPTNQTVVPAGSSSSSRPVAKPQVSVNSQSVRPSQHPGQPGHHSASHQTLPRPTHDPARHPDAGHARDQSRSYSDALRGPHDHARPRDHSRPHESVRSYDTARHGQGHPDHRPDLGTDVKHIPHSEPSLNRSQSSRPEQTSHRTSNVSPNTPPANTLTVKSSSPPELASDISHILSSSGDMPDTNTSSPESLLKLQSNLDKQRHALSQGPKLSLTMYRERASAKSRTPAEQSTPGDNANALVNITDDTFTVGANPESLTNSPADVAMRLGSGDLANFHKPQDSPNNPRIKIKVKRDPSSGERHAVKYADTGLKIKIKPIRSEAPGGAEGGDAGPSGVGVASSASTPREEGEIIEDTPPSSGDSEQKSERLKIRLSVPKSDHGSSSYNKRESDQGSNGHSGEHEQGHRSHHHSHHRSHHHSKSKKHSKHDRSRHEGKSSNKRSASALDHYDERPSKSSRSDTFSASTGDASHRHAGYSDFTSSNSSTRSHQQNTGFSIHDAFSSTMPHNIFDDDDDPAHAHPPVTPTVETVPPHHERFHQLMADHRAKLESRKPPLPKGPPPPTSSPPPPPPPPTM